jgi:hypothetical protein
MHASQESGPVGLGIDAPHCVVAKACWCCGLVGNRIRHACVALIILAGCQALVAAARLRRPTHVMHWAASLHCWCCRSWSALRSARAHCCWNTQRSESACSCHGSQCHMQPTSPTSICACSCAPAAHPQCCAACTSHERQVRQCDAFMQQRHVLAPAAQSSINGAAAAEQGTLCC